MKASVLPKNPLIQQNMLDKLITYVSPKAGQRRMIARSALALAGGYTGAKVNRAALKNWQPGGGSPETDISADLPMLRDRTRDAVRNAPVAAGAVANTVSATVGTGLSCNPGINHKVLGITSDAAALWNESTRESFEVWAASMDCAISGDMDFYQQQDLGLRSSLESGDSWVLTPLMDLPGRGQQLVLQLVEADRVCNPANARNTDTLQDGVELNEHLRKVAIHVAKRHPGDLKVGNSWERIEVRGATTGRRNALQIWKPLRPSQVRGVPLLAPVLEPLKQLTSWTENELAAAVTSSLFTLFVKMDADAFQEVFEPEAQTALVAQNQKWSGDLENAKAVRLLPGEEIQPASMSRPNPDFDPFWIAMVRQIGMAIQVPYEVLVMHFQSSYSAARGALLMAWRFYRERRDLLAKQFCQPVYELWLENEIYQGRIAAPGFFANPYIRAAWCRATWTGDGPGAIDPTKEVAAAKDRVDMGISTLESESVAYDGVSWEVKNTQRAREIEIQKQTGTYRAPASPGGGAPANAPTEGQPNGRPDGSDDDNETPPTPARQRSRAIA